MKGPLFKTPEDDKSLAAVMRFIQRAIGMDMENCLPAQVEAYDRTRNVANVRPMIVMTKRAANGGDLQRVPRVMIPDVPVISLGAGGFHISFPVKNGDLGWIYACDRDISVFMETLTQSPAGRDGPSHLFSDSIFIPDAFRQYTINSEDEGALVIQSTNSATRISVREDNIKITTPVKVTIDTPTTEILHDLTVGGNTTMTGKLDVAGVTTLPATTTVAGKPVDGHTHGGAVPPF